MTTQETRTVSAFSQWAALAKAEFTLLRRNTVQVMYAIALPLAVPLLFIPLANNAEMDEQLGMVVALILAIGLVFVSYYNTLSAAVNRREEQVLTRLRAGEVGDSTILTSLVTPGLFLGLVMSVGMFAVAVAALDLPIPTNISLLAACVIVTVVLFLLAGLVTAIYTRTAESAQITSLPVIMVLTVGPSLLTMRSLMNDRLATITEYVPTTAMADVMATAWFGADIADATKPMLILIGWVVATAMIVATKFRWSRRG